MSDDRTREATPEFIDTPAGAPMLQTLGQATKAPGRCACGEHPDPAGEHTDPSGEHTDPSGEHTHHA